jgi:hypothetical protein
MNTSFRHKWSNALRNGVFRYQFIRTIGTLLLLAILIPYHFNYIQYRSAIALHDPILLIVPPRDVSAITFTIIYVSIFLTLVSLSQNPEQLALSLQAYGIMNILRIISSLLVPLDEPIGIIVLYDPLIAIVGYGGNIITKDLFFSGHVATMTLLFLSVNNGTLKKVLFLTTILVAFLLLIQHVHYTIDLLVAPIFAVVSFCLSKLLTNRDARA